MPSTTALVRRPSSRLADGIVTHIARSPIDLDRALRQWEGYVAALQRCGWKTIEVAPADDCADSVFIEDTVVMFGNLAVLCHPGAPSRLAELRGVEQAIAALDCPIGRIVSPGTLDGGDVLKVGTTAYVGRGGRTNDEGIRQLRDLIAPHGWVVVAVPLSRVLHLKSAVTALPDGTIIGHSAHVDDRSIFPRFLAVPEESGSHVVVLDEHRLLLADDCPQTVAMLCDLGYETVLVDIGEFVKLEGCVTCLSVRLRHLAGAP